MESMRLSAVYAAAILCVRGASATLAADAHLVVDALLDAMVNMDQRRKAIFLAFHDVIPGTTYVKPGKSWSPELRRAFDRTMEEVRAIIEERRVSPRSDFISDLVNARDQGDKLSDSELFDQIFGICGASLSATSRAAGGALYLLYTHPEQLDQLIRNPALIPDALEECFRLASNGYFTFPRIATRDTEVGGTPILKGMVVRPSPLAPNYDPDVFPNPTRFDIHRKPKRIISSGAGPHHCIGNILGRTTITIAIRSRPLLLVVDGDAVRFHLRHVNLPLCISYADVSGRNTNRRGKRQARRTCLQQAATRDSF